MGLHSRGYIANLVFGTFLFILLVTTLILAYTGWTVLLPYSVQDIYFMYRLDVDIPPWAFILWILALFWLFLIYLFGLATVCRKSRTSPLVYQTTPYLPGSMYAIMWVSHIAQIGWVVCLSHQYMIFAQLFNLMTSVTLYGSRFISIRALHRHLPELCAKGLEKEASVIRGLVHNGLSFYAGLVDVMVMLSLSKILVYYAAWSQNHAALLGLVIYLVWIVLGLILEVTIWDRYTRYSTMAYYVMALVVRIAVAAYNLDVTRWEITDYLLVISLALSVGALLAKIIIVCTRYVVGTNGKKPKRWT